MTKRKDPDEEEQGLDRLAEGLLEYETLSGDEIKDLIAGRKAARATWATTRRLRRGSAVPKTGAKKPRRAKR